MADLARSHCDVEIVTYRQRQPDCPYLDDLLLQLAASNKQSRCIFVVSWGFDIRKLLPKLRHHHVVYHAHSAGYGFTLPVDIPIVAVSRNTLGYWGQAAPNSPLFYLPNPISPEFRDRQQPRDIDILVQTRKTSRYVLDRLVPALQPFCRVQLLDTYVEDLVGLFNRSKLYLYDSAEYWAATGVTEGFGLPPMEAMACGCQVFSSVNSALADYLDPGFNCQKIAVHSLEYDLQRLKAAIAGDRHFPPDPSFFDSYRPEPIRQKLGEILAELDRFFDCCETHSPDLVPLTRRRLAHLRWQQFWQKVLRKLGR